MEILKRAKGKADGEVVPWNESEDNVREEVNKRASKAGYCNSDGTPISTGAGKGDSYRPVNKRRYDRNYEKIFGHK